MSKVFISVDQRLFDKGLQISISSDDGIGYRIAGPKYDGQGKNLLKHYLTERDIQEIRDFLRKATPS